MTNVRMKAALLAVSIIASVLFVAVPAQAAAHHVVRTAHLQKTTAKRFKRGVRRTGKKIRHFIHRASGKH